MGVGVGVVEQRGVCGEKEAEDEEEMACVGRVFAYVLGRAYVLRHALQLFLTRFPVHVHMHRFTHLIFSQGLKS